MPVSEGSERKGSHSLVFTCLIKPTIILVKMILDFSVFSESSESEIYVKQ